MEREPNNQLPASAERVRLKKPIGRPVFRLFAFVVCTAILVAAFAVSQIWSGRGEAIETPFGGLFHRKRVTELPGQSEPAPETDGSPSETDVNDAPSTRRARVPTEPFRCLRKHFRKPPDKRRVRKKLCGRSAFPTMDPRY